MVTGIVQRVMGKNVSINLGKADAVLSENEQVKGEVLKPTERIKVYILEVKDTPKGPRILVSRTHPGLVKRLFESEVAEVKDGTVEIKSIAREAGSRTKIAAVSYTHLDVYKRQVFNMLSGYSEPKKWNKLIVAPIWMKDRFLKLIEREAEHAKKGMPAYIVAKMNSLCDPVIMEALYYASSCGVQIHLLVRGICCLKVGIPGVSENIHVRSIVGDFLEHSRIFYFHNGGSEEIYMGSADWMPRNLDRRVEIVFPVEDEAIKKELVHVLTLEFKDNVKAHLLKNDGTYEKQDKRGKTLVNSQMEFCREATERAQKKQIKKEKSRVFIPAESAEDVEE